MVFWEQLQVLLTVHMVIIGERAKRARHSQVCSIEIREIYKTYYIGQHEIWWVHERLMPTSEMTWVSMKYDEFMSGSCLRVKLLHISQWLIVYDIPYSYNWTLTNSSIQYFNHFNAMTVVKTMLFNMRAQCSVKYKVWNMGWYLTLRVIGKCTVSV